MKAIGIARLRLLRVWIPRSSSGKDDRQPKIIRFVDLFGGVGGFRLGLERANASQTVSLVPGRQEDSPASGNHNGGGRVVIQEGFRCVNYCELDKNAVKVYNQNFGEAHEPADARRLDPSALPGFDLLCAGFPCQSFSMAGKRRGFEDTRGTLFFEIARLAEVARPRLLLLENVKGLLSHDEGWTFYRILSVLDEMGYDCEWEVLNSKHFGVPQNRERVFIVGHLRGEPWGEIFPLGQGSGISLGSRQEAQGGREWLRSVDSNYWKGGARQMIGTNPEGAVLREDSPTLRPSARVANNGPMVIGWQNSKDGAIPKEESPSLRASGGTDIRKRPAVVVESALIHGRGLESRKDGVSHSLKGAEGGYSKNFAILRLDDNESIEHRLYDSEGLAPSLPTGATGGNLIPKIANTVTDGWLMDTSHHAHPMNQYRIRRLTPVECERLQGFPDNWTAGVSDTQRYKMMGNAVTVNVIQAIGEKILEVESQP